MPWGSKDSPRFTKKPKSAKAKRQWADVADSALARTGDEGVAIREANGVAARYNGAGRKASNSKARTGKSRSWVGK